MNLHQIVRGAVTAVAPDRTVYRLPCLGQQTGTGYQVQPVYGPCEAVTAQVQPVADKTLQWLIQSRQNTIWRDLYVSGLSFGLDRAEDLGGDLYYFDGAEWQVDQVLGRLAGRGRRRLDEDPRLQTACGRFPCRGRDHPPAAGSARCGDNWSERHGGSAWLIPTAHGPRPPQVTTALCWCRLWATCARPIWGRMSLSGAAGKIVSAVLRPLPGYRSPRWPPHAMPPTGMWARTPPSIPGQTVTAGAVNIIQPRSRSVQLDFFGPDAARWAHVISAALWDMTGCDFLASYGVVPLETDDPRDLTGMEGNEQAVIRWMVETRLQYNLVVDLPQDYFSNVNLGLHPQA